MTGDLTKIERHFSFGENWKSFLSAISEDNLREAKYGLSRLILPNQIVGKTFLDIGCGSGIHMLSALELGASRATGIDIDCLSVEAAKVLLETMVEHKHWRVMESSIFDFTDKNQRMNYDVVYSWGVLHHTGAIWEAIKSAASLVGEQGYFIVALYPRTYLDWFWILEKPIYSRSPKIAQMVIRAIYKTLFILALIGTGRNPIKYINCYKRARGMDWHHDIHDWLGGYPYETADPNDVIDFLKGLNFIIVSVSQHKKKVGLFGSGCVEYVAKRVS